MRLSGIKLAGFKSFVDPAQLPLPSNLTAVVGPNGCGKSNIIDAVRWVLGEASIKTLRGADTEDVIFNGSRSRKPAGRASVELIFDNSDGKIIGPYAAYSEISVRRELTRDGGSQYYLNTRKCLKRDVTDLFLGTGLGGKNQYAIIEQGMVSRMVEAKPEELRHWLEEAAGISKYKERRRETESRIRQSRENLARLQDLQNELHARLEVLVKQAANAEKYREFKQQERRHQAELLLLRSQGLAHESHAHEQLITRLTQASVQARLDAEQADTAALDADAACQTAQGTLSQEQAKVYEAEAQSSRAEQALGHARELAQLQQRDYEQGQARLTDLSRRLTQEQTRQQEAEAQLQLANEQLIAHRSTAEAQQAELVESEAVLTREQGEWERLAAQAQAPLLAAEGERVRAQQLERALRGAEDRQARLSTESAGLNAEPIRAALSEVEAELNELNSGVETHKASLETLDRDISQQRETRSSLEKSLADARQQLSAAKARMASLETLQQAAMRQDDGELRSWMDRFGYRDRQRLAETLRVANGWELAVEHVLDTLLQAPLLPDLQALLNAPEQGPKTGSALVLQDAADLNDQTQAVAAPVETPARLSAFVQAPAPILDLLAKVWIAATDAEATATAAELAAADSVITQAGTWRGRGWVRYPKTAQDKGGVIARSAQLRELRQTVDYNQELVRTQESELSDLQGRMRSREAERRDAMQRLDQARARQAQRLAFRQSQQVRLEQIEARLRTVTADLQQATAQVEQQRQELAQCRTQLQILETQAEQIRAARHQAQQQLAEVRANAQSARARASRSLQLANDAEVQKASRSAALNGLLRSVQELEVQRSAAEQQLASLAQHRDAALAPLAELEAKVPLTRQAVDATRAGLRTAREVLTLAEQTRGEAIHLRRQCEAAKDEAQRLEQQARLEFENLRTRRDGLDAQFAETGFEREELLQALPADVTATTWEDKLAALGRKIDRLGAINLAAIEELSQARERETYLATQHADVADALNTLEEAMRKLDRETEDRFKETFQRVDTIFRDRFPKLFGGGEAYLEMTSDDPQAGSLNWGVRVMARPPGKRNSTIQLLSGGEKAMTAVALLFALFELNPAPFCLMDEVDAPLDDANVNRYCEVIREMSQRVQFIIITHNKITMELANQLHGVTMQEPGVSRLVAVDVEQALAYAATGPVAVPA